MKQLFNMFILTVATSIVSVCQVKVVGQDLGTKPQKDSVVKKCPENSDSLYDRRRILAKLANTLNHSVPEYKRVVRSGFKVEEDKGVGFFIYDLTEISNKGTPLYDCVNFKNNHVYHFAPIKHHYSLSHIVVLEDGKLKIFRAINCKDRGDTIEDVISYLNQKLMNDKDKDDILGRVKSYRKYGTYVTVDDTSLVCEEIGNGKEAKQ